MFTTLMERWLSCVNEADKGELVELAKDEGSLRDAFYRDLAFGTGGLRGIVGMGPNRMNVYTVAKATQGLADYLNSRFDSPSVAIARDSRRMGDEFVHEAARVLAANGVRAFLYPRIEPTPALSFAVRELGCSAGICVTASHNPAPYNGYKVYGPDGCQITTRAAKDIQAAIDAVDVFESVQRVGFDYAVAAGLVEWIGEDTLDRYVHRTLEQAGTAPDVALSAVYTPLHGTGLECVSRVMEGLGVRLYVEPSQAVPDGEFPTCPKPNPEERAALELGLELCRRTSPDLLLATDPDSDRVGIAAAATGGRFQLLSGNEVGILLLDYAARAAREAGDDLARKVAVTTVVSSAMADDLAAKRGFELRRTLTGFKFIGEQVGLLESQGREGDFLLGFEESYGYLVGSHVRDKDAVVACALICQMARWWKARGKSLVDAMGEIYAEFGFDRNALVSVEYPGAEGASRMAAIMSGLRSEPPDEVAGLAVERVVDYLEGVPMPTVNAAPGSEAQTLPSSDVLELRLAGGNKLIVRPSGTEPKVKAYIFARGADANQAEAMEGQLVRAAKDLLGQEGL